MISIGLDTSNSLVYEADSSKYNGRLLWPTPVISHANIVQPDSKEFKAKSSQDVFGYIFREDYFDPITRIRRGRFYKAENSLNQDWRILPHPAKPYKGHVNPGVPHPERLDTFTSNMSVWHEYIAGKQEKPFVLLGRNDCYTVWEIVAVEEIHTRESLVTLKARDSLGVLPRLIPENIPKRYREALQESVQIFMDEAYRSAPSSVIDRARDVATWAANAYLELSDEKTEDLGELVKKLRDQKRVIAESAANIIARLHARAKPVEQEKRKLPPIRERGAQLSVQCVGALLCELGYAE